MYSLESMLGIGAAVGLSLIGLWVVYAAVDAVVRRRNNPTDRP